MLYKHAEKGSPWCGGAVRAEVEALAALITATALMAERIPNDAATALLRRALAALMAATGANDDPDAAGDPEANAVTAFSQP